MPVLGPLRHGHPGDRQGRGRAGRHAAAGGCGAPGVLGAAVRHPGLGRPFQCDHHACLARRLVQRGRGRARTAAVAGGWWRNGLKSPNVSGEPQGFRVIDINSGQIESQYVTLQEGQSQLASWYTQEETDRHFINVFDASPETQVHIEDIGKLQPLNPFSDSTKRLSPHLYELSANDIEQIASSETLSLTIIFENGQTNQLEIGCPSFKQNNE